MTHALVTGATGFIGGHLVRALAESGAEVTCLVREQSDCSQLVEFKPRLVYGDVTDADSLRGVFRGVDVVYHLAGATKSLRRRDLDRTNREGVRNVALACAHQPNPPILIHISSLAAGGPAMAGRPRIESDGTQPVSNYGHSKLAGEQAARVLADEFPLTILRPPIVLGEADRDGLNMFDSIARWNLHVVPGLTDERFSVVHGDDLAQAMILAAMYGGRAGVDGGSEGIYYVAADETPTYAELGQMIGRAVGQERVYVIRSPKSAVWAIAAVNELASHLRGRPHILGIDKAREATAGSWTCDDAALRHDTGFAPAYSLQERIEQTALWYARQGWINSPIAADAPQGEVKAESETKTEVEAQ